MGIRNRPNRSRGPLLVAAAAITRAVDPVAPSRVTVLRLLGDAIHIFEESQLVVDEIKDRNIKYSSRNSTPLPRHQVESDNRTRQAHDQGARALFSATSSALIKLPARAGPLRRRAVELMLMTGRAAGPAVVMQAADNCRSHIARLKRLTWSSAENSDFDVVCAIMTLAEISNCVIAGRDVAKDSIHFLLGQKVKHKCRRADLAYAIAIILQSFPVHAPPDDRMIDSLLDFALSSFSIKHGGCGIGAPLLVSIAVPFLVSRGPTPADDVVAACGRAMRNAPIATERSMWAVAMTRASVTARRSTTYQIRRYGNSEAGAKFPSNSFNRLPQRAARDPEDSNPSVWVSMETFEESLEQVAKTSGLEEGRADASIAVASVFRMWVQALPENQAEIVPRAFARLLPMLHNISAVSALVDAVWLGLLKGLKPSLSPLIFEKLLPLLVVNSEQTSLRSSAVLYLCASLLQKFGRESIRESGSTLQYGEIAKKLMQSTQDALAVSSHYVRVGGVRLMQTLLQALPRACSQIVTAVLQNLRIADLALITRAPSSCKLDSFSGLKGVEQELSSILGNALALSLLVQRISSRELSVPNAMVLQCNMDCMSLLRMNRASGQPHLHGNIASCIRRRAGWGLIAARAQAKHRSLLEKETLSELLALWKHELSFAAGTTIRSDGSRASPRQSFDSSRGISHEDYNEVPFDEVLAMSSTRSAALHALLCVLRLDNSGALVQITKAIIGACAARIVHIQAAHCAHNSQGVLWGAPGVAWGVDASESGMERRRNLWKLSRSLAVETFYLMQCIVHSPPRGDVAELCYFLALSLAEEAEREGGESQFGSAIDTAISNAKSSMDKSGQADGIMANHRPSLTKLFLHQETSEQEQCHSPLRNEHAERYNAERPDIVQDTDTSWMFSMPGMKTLAPEEVQYYCATAIAGLASVDLSDSGSIIESLSTSKLSPCFSGVVALELSRKLSRSDFAEINRCLALLQILAKKSLGVTGGCQKAILAESKEGRLFTPSLRGDSMNFGSNDTPGSVLQKLAYGSSWIQWARRFSNDGLITRSPFHDFHTRAMGNMLATRSIAAKAHQKLGMTGGPKIWIGMMRRVISDVKDNLSCLSCSQAVALSSAVNTLGALMEVIPEPSQEIHTNQSSKTSSGDTDLSFEIDEIGNKAVNILAEVVEKGNTDAQEAAALALSNSSIRTASSSETLIGSILKAWTNERGEYSSFGYVGRCAMEAEVWQVCFHNIWRDMGIRLTDSDIRFFPRDSCGIGSNSASLMTATSAVLSSCRLNWWAVTESCYSTALEMSIELSQWHGSYSKMSRAAGLYGLTTVWASRIDEEKVRRSSTTGVNKKADIPARGEKEYALSSSLVPIEDFSLKEASRSNSPVGPFLDDVIYDALSPAPCTMPCGELQKAATAAITEMMRGAGVQPTCFHLPRLPEVLFSALNDGCLEAGRSLLVLSKTDGVKRPKYWFGLCRAICLSKERLNYGAKKTLWDVSCSTRVFAVKAATETVDNSLAAYHCSAKESIPSKNAEKQSSAYSFLSKILKFVEDSIHANKQDVLVCAESCVLLERVAARIGSFSEFCQENDLALRNYEKVLYESLEDMDALLTDHVPHFLVKNAAMAASELLVSAVQLSHLELFALSQVKVTSFLEKSTERNIRQQFLYSDQGEEIGVHASMAVIEMFSKVVTALSALSRKTGDAFDVTFPELFSFRDFFLAVIGDFVCTLRDEELQPTAETVGALTSGFLSSDELKKLLSPHIPSVVLGAISCTRSYKDKSDNCLLRSWMNKNAAGAKLVQDVVKYGNVPMACFVWVLKNDKQYYQVSEKESSFTRQSQDALINACASSDGRADHMKEVLAAYARRGSQEFINVFESVIHIHFVSLETKTIMQELVVQTLIELVGNADEDDYEEILQTMLRVLRLLSEYTKVLLKTQSNEANASACKVMDDILSLAQLHADFTAEMYEDITLQKEICDSLSLCLKNETRDEQSNGLWTERIEFMFWEGYRKNSVSHLKLAVSIAATVSDFIEDEKAVAKLSRLLFSPLPDENVNSNRECLVLDAALECHGIERFLIRALAPEASSQEILSATQALGFELSRLALSVRPFCIPVALQVSVSAMNRKESTGKGQIAHVLYAILIAKLVRTLPKEGPVLQSAQDLPQSDAFQVHMTIRKPEMLQMMIPLLGEDDRQSLRNFLDSSDASRAD